MTKTHLTLLALACACALTACGAQDAPADAAHAEATAKSSSAGLPRGDATAGKALAEKKGTTGQACVDCHGAEGNAPIDDSYPKLGGQYADYLAHALQAYRSGDRGGSAASDLMAGQSKELTDQQIADLSAYFGSASSQLRDLSAVN
jgi:cytochrome c553